MKCLRRNSERSYDTDLLILVSILCTRLPKNCHYFAGMVLKPSTRYIMRYSSMRLRIKALILHSFVFCLQQLFRTQQQQQQQQAAAAAALSAAAAANTPAQLQMLQQQQYLQQQQLAAAAAGLAPTTFATAPPTPYIINPQEPYVIAGKSRDTLLL